jgi:hypothetical protein
VTGLSVMPSHGLRMQIKVQREYMEGRPLLRASAWVLLPAVRACVRLLRAVPREGDGEPLQRGGGLWTSVGSAIKARG